MLENFDSFCCNNVIIAGDFNPFFSKNLECKGGDPYLKKHSVSHIINPIQDGLFRGCSPMVGGKKAPLPKVCHTCPTMMKLGTVIPYLKKIQKIYESRDTPFKFC